MVKTTRPIASNTGADGFFTGRVGTTKSASTCRDASRFGSFVSAAGGLPLLYKPCHPHVEILARAARHHCPRSPSQRDALVLVRSGVAVREGVRDLVDRCAH